MAFHPNWHMFFFISPIICVVTASILVVVTDPSSLCISVLDHCQWLLLLLLLVLAFFLREKRSSSSSSLASFVVPERKYEVFLNFRGTDTRYGFLSHLCGALYQKKIDYFLDDQNLQQGNEISPALLAAIEQSEASLVIFSKSYASSTWCLEELAHIIECMENHNQIVIPVFYKIDPSSIRHQKGSYKDAFVQHEKRFDKQKLQKWRDVLKKASDLSGFHSSNYKTEADFITEVVQCVLKKLNMTSYHDDLKCLVGIQERTTHLETLLRKKSQNVFIIGIWGTGGIGKTTIAEVLFKRLYNEYEGRCFLHIREGLEKHGTIQLKGELLSKLLGEDPDIVMHNGILPDCERRLRRKKVLVVLDDINKLMQLEMLLGRCEWFGTESRIIVTSRNKDIIIKICDFVYEVEQLSSKEALQLFNLNAMPEICLDKEHERCKLSELVVEYAKGNPLAIKVLGSSLYGRNKSEWESKLKKLDKILDPEIQGVLQLSYDDLDDEQKNIFLYLACFFREDLKERIISLLDDDDYHTIDGLRVLQNRALINISSGEIVSMHDLIRKMGCEIVRRKCPKNPSQRNHLWDSDDIYEVLKNNKGTEEIESISLKMWRLKRDLHVRPQAFAKMGNLKLLRFEADYSWWTKKEDYPLDNRFTVYVPEEGIILPNKLRYFDWDFYPSKSLPLRSIDNLVELHMRGSRLQKPWDGIQELPKLKIIDLSSSKELIEFPDLSNAQNLESVCLEGCSSLTKLPDSTGHLPSLEILKLSGTNVETLPTSIKHSSRLRNLVIKNCRRLRSLQGLPSSIEYLIAHDCPSLETLQFNSMPLNLVALYMRHSNLRRVLWDGIQDLPSLKVFDLSFSRELIELPDLSKAPNLERLDLYGCEKVSHVQLWRNHNMEERKNIYLGSQVSLTSLSTEASEEDDHLDLCGRSLPVKPSFKYYVFPSLQILDLAFCYGLTELPDNIGLYLPSLQTWKLRGTKVETLPASIKHLSQLTSLDLIECYRLRNIPALPPSIQYLAANDCRLLETIQFTSNSMPLSHQKHKLCIDLYNCVKLDDHKLEAVARHYKLITERIISARIKDTYTELYFPISKVPECFSSYRATQDSVSVPLELPLHSEAMDFIFCFVRLQKEIPIFGFEIKCHIELSNAPKVQFITRGPYLWNIPESISDHTLLWYENSLSLKIMDEVSRIKASTTTDDLYARVWFELDCPGVQEWGVYPIFISSEPIDVTNAKGCPDVNDNNDNGDDEEV